MASYCHHWLHLRRNPSLCNPCHGYYILCRFLQTGCRFSHGSNHCQQKPLGLRVRGIYHALGFESRLYSTDNDEYEPDNSMVLLWDLVLLFWQDFQTVVEEQLGTQTMKDGQ